MNKIVSVSLIVVSSIFLSACGAPKTDTPSQEAGPSTENQYTTNTASLTELIGMGKNLECVWTIPANDNQPESKGSMYLSGKKFRQDISTSMQADGTTLQMGVISDGVDVYMWNSSDTKNGIKMNLEESKKLSEGEKTETPQQTSVDLENKVDYKCKSWSADESKFVLPTGITFSDFGAQLRQMQQLKESAGMKIPSISIPAGKE